MKAKYTVKVLSRLLACCLGGLAVGSALAVCDAELTVYRDFLKKEAEAPYSSPETAAALREFLGSDMLSYYVDSNKAKSKDRLTTLDKNYESDRRKNERELLISGSNYSSRESASADLYKGCVIKYVLNNYETLGGYDRCNQAKWDSLPADTLRRTTDEATKGITQYCPHLKWDTGTGPADMAREIIAHSKQGVLGCELDPVAIENLMDRKPSRRDEWFKGPNGQACKDYFLRELSSNGGAGSRPNRPPQSIAVASSTSTATDTKQTPATDPLKSQSQQSQDRVLDAQKQANVKPSNNSRYGYLDLVQACIELKETRRESIAQWYSVTNTCSMKVKFFSAPNSPTYGSLKILSPGQTDTSWWNYVKKPKLPWVACPADAPNGNNVSVEGDANGPVACRYLL